MLILTHNADKYGYLGHFGKNHTQPKTRPKEEIFSMMQVVSHRIRFTCILYPLSIRKMPFYALVFTLCSKVDLIWTSAFRLVIAQSVQFHKIAKKLYIDLCQYFSHWKEALFLLESWKKKKWGLPYSFLRQSCRKYTPHAFSLIIERGLARVSKWHVCGRGKKALNNPFFQNLHRDITVTCMTQCDKNDA